MRLKILTIISFLFISFHARSAMFMEPSFAYIVSGSYDVTYTGGKSENTVEGYSGMLKLGWSTAGFSLGGLVKRGKSEMINSSGTSTGYSWTTQYGGFVGYSLPIMLSFGVSYILPPTAHSESTYSGLTSSTLVFGVSYSIVPFVRLQVAYGMSMSPKYVVSGTANDLPYTAGIQYTELSTNAITVGLGVPIPLGF